MCGQRQLIVEPKLTEPWVDLPDEGELADWGRAEEIAHNQVNRQTQKYAFFVNAFDFITSLGICGDYYEFGCHRVRTFRMALTEARRHSLDTMRFLAFDSFEGLPDPETETGVEEYFRGALHTSEEAFLRLVSEHGIYTEKVRTFKGFYQHTLTAALQEELLAGGTKIAIACVDCDLYESAAPVFRFIAPLLQEGTVVYIDDYFAGLRGSPATGPALAFHEFERESPFRFAPHMQVGWWGRSFLAFLGK